MPAEHRGFYYPNHTGSLGNAYGMISPYATLTTATFRRDKFGQFRDMLEQRPDSKLFIENSSIKQTAFVEGSPVQVRFVNRADGVTPADPYDTDSGNFSVECTSSLPYSDKDPALVTSPGGSVVLEFAGTLLEGFPGLFPGSVTTT